MAQPYRSSSSMTNIQLHRPKLHQGQAEVRDHAKRFNVLVCGRRWGKTVLGIRLVTSTAIHGAPSAFFSPTYKMLSDVWRETKLMLAPITAKVSEQEHRLELTTGGVLDMWSLDNPDSARGRKYKRVIIDEAAMIRYLETAWTHVIRPTLADMEGDAFFTSTPKGLNYFYTLYQMDAPDWYHGRFPTSTNPFIKPAEINEMRRLLPERVFKQEILAEFIADGSFFQNVDKMAVVMQPDQSETHKDHYVVAGLDWALSEDYSVLTIGCRDCNRVIYWWRDNKIDYTWQRERIAQECRRYNVKALLPERNSIGEPNIEMLVRDKINIAYGPDGVKGFATTATTKPELIMKLAGALEHGGFQVPADYADELRSYEVETMASGHPKFGAPSGYHDDRVISLALCWWAMTMYSRHGGIHA